MLRLIFFSAIFFSSFIPSSGEIISAPSDDSLSFFPLLSKDTSYVRIYSITIIGNKKTKPEIIFRELTFHKDDSLSQQSIGAAIQRSKENLLNTSLFNFVDVFYKTEDSIIDVIIIVSERWYIWPLPIFEIVDRNINEWLLTKDFSRTNYGLYLVINNFRGRNETLSLSFRTGYTQRYSLQYTIPYISKNQREGISFAVSWSRNHEIAYNTVKNKLVYFKDDHANVRQEFYASVQISFRSHLYNTTSLKVEFDNMEVSDTIPFLNPYYFNSQRTKQQYFGFTYLFKRDHRDLVSYPLHGNYFDLEVFKRGFKFLNDDVDQLYLASSFRYYSELRKNIFFATSIKGKLSGTSPQPYNVTRALGYGRDVIRSYELYVVDGQNFLLLKNNLKFRLLPTVVKKVDFIPSEKFSTIPLSFYLNLFYDMGYVRDEQYDANNPLTNSFLPGYGIGIDLVSYYDIVFTVEYSINKFAEKDIFFRFTISI